MREDAPIDEEGEPGRPRRKVYRVLELTRFIKETLEDHVGPVWVEGEISNLGRPASGHMYFTLKDESAQLTAVLFKGNQRGPALEIKDGQQVRAFGRITVYEARGAYQIIVEQLEAVGQGSLLEQFQKLKRKLKDEGLFDPERKEALPPLPRHIGVVTSRTGAAVRDILHVLRRRYPNLHVLVVPVKVQGDGAAEMIVKAIRFLNERGGIDLMIVGRGGGSLEDLWAFNEEQVARAVAASRVPVISAVGHETDVTICDLAADVRAPTPSAAAEIAVPEKGELAERLRTFRGALARALHAHQLGLRNRLTRCASSYVFREPRNVLSRYRERIAVLARAKTRSLQVLFQQRQQRVDELATSYVFREPEKLLTRYRECVALLAATQRRHVEVLLRQNRQDLRRLEAQLQALNPHAVLARGYSITHNEEGALVRRARDVAPGQALHTRLSLGTVTSRVEATTEDNDDGDQE